VHDRFGEGDLHILSFDGDAADGVLSIFGLIFASDLSSPVAGR
jgi:hypothetical protein